MLFTARGIVIAVVPDAPLRDRRACDPFATVDSATSGNVWKQTYTVDIVSNDDLQLLIRRYGRRSESCASARNIVSSSRELYEPALSSERRNGKWCRVFVIYLIQIDYRCHHDRLIFIGNHWPIYDGDTEKLQSIRQCSS